MRLTRIAGLAAAFALVATTAAPGMVSAHERPVEGAGGIPAYQHIFVVVMENHNYQQIIGNPHAPRINSLAQRYGLATHYYGITHPSEPNYVALIGGSNFGIQSDDPYSDTAGQASDHVNHTITASNLADQLEAAGLSWKSYQQSLPYPGYTGTYYPSSANPLYASKHDPFLNFADIQTNPARLQKIVPDTQLFTDLQSDAVPNVSFIAPDQCHDMHGGAPTCPYANNADDPKDKNDIFLVQQGDAYVANLVDTITSSRTWKQGNNAIVVTWDENDNYDNRNDPASYTGCCDAPTPHGGGQVVTIVIANHLHYGPHGIQDATPYNHYALLRTIQTAFRLGCVQYTCDTANVPLMTPLFGHSADDHHDDGNGHGNGNGNH